MFARCQPACQVFTVISYRVNNVHWTCNNLLNSLVQIIDIQKVTVYVDSVYNLYYSKIECTIWILIFWSVCLRFISAWSDRLGIYWEIRRNSSYSVILNLLSKFCNNFFRLLYQSCIGMQCSSECTEILFIKWIIYLRMYKRNQYPFWYIVTFHWDTTSNVTDIYIDICYKVSDSGSTA